MGGTYRIELDQRRSIGQILGATARLYLRYPWLFVVLAAGVMIPFELIVLAITGHGPLGRGKSQVGVALLTSLAQGFLATPLISALHIHAVVEIGAGRRPRLGAVARRGLEVLPVVMAADIVSGLGIGLASLALLVPGMILAARWVVVAQAAALEGEDWSEALRSSGRLAHGNYLRAFGLLVLLGAINEALSLTFRSLSLGSDAAVGSVVAGIVLYTIITSLSALTLALLYFDLRARHREGNSAGA